MTFRYDTILSAKGEQDITRFNLDKRIIKLNLRLNKIKKINGLGHLKDLKELELSDNDISHISGLDNLYSLQLLSLSHNNISSLGGFDSLVKLEKLFLQDNKLKTTKGIGRLNNLLRLDFEDNQIVEIEGLDKLPNLKILFLRKNKITEIRGLSKLTNLEDLDFEENKIRSIKGLSKLRKLKSLHFRVNHIKEIKGIDNLVELESLGIGYNEIKVIKGLDNLTKLEFLDLGNNDIEAITGLGSLVNLRQLNLFGNKITSLEGIDNLDSLENLFIPNNPLDECCLDELLGYRMRGKLRSLKDVDVSRTKINWRNDRAGKAAWKLQRLGVTIQGDDINYVPPSPKQALIDEFIKRINVKWNLSEADVLFIWDRLANRTNIIHQDIKEIILSDKGYTSRVGFTFKDKFIKVDLAVRLKAEYLFYSLEDLGDFSEFMPRSDSFEFVSSEDDDMAILAMDNLRSEKYSSGFMKLNHLYGTHFLDHGVHYNIFLMSVFHKETLKHLDKFDTVIYSGVHGLPHYEENYEPYFNVSGEGLRRFEDTQINSKEVAPKVKRYKNYQEKNANSVVHADWKDDNLVNGHLVDYAMVGRGLVVDELAYYLSDYKFDYNLEQFHNFIDIYITYRKNHDKEFEYKINEGYDKELRMLADSAFLSQLVLRHSVMNKRDMLDPEKFRQRLYYQQRIDETLNDKKARFV